MVRRNVYQLHASSGHMTSVSPAMHMQLSSTAHLLLLGFCLRAGATLAPSSWAGQVRHAGRGGEASGPPFPMAIQ
jgi:hypothetical protein